MVREILLLGNPELYRVSERITEGELADVHGWVNDLHDTMIAYRRRWGAGRAIAAPQIGVRKRLIYMHTDAPYVFINPELYFPDSERYTLLDDCMSFPGLLVRVERNRRAVIRYRDLQFAPQEMALEGDLAELLQHEYDHLDGVLATMRAVDDKAFVLRSPPSA